VLAGLDGFFGGIRFVLTTPAVWPYAAAPMLAALLLGCVLTALGFWGAAEVARSWVGEGGWATLGNWLVTLSLGLALMIASVFLALALAQPLSGWALEAVARQQEKALTGVSPHEPSFLYSLWVSVRCTLFTLVVGTTLIGGLFMANLLFPPAVVVTLPLKVVVAAWLLAWDFVDYPLGLRGMGLRRRAAWVRVNFKAFTAFGLAWTAVLLIPFLGLLVLPFAVAGATRLVVASERGQ
jgi:CysZ protein